MTGCRCSEECRAGANAAAWARRQARARAGVPGRVPAVQVARHIKELFRTHRHTTAADIAAAAGLSRRTVEMILRDAGSTGRTVNLGTAEKILRVRRVSTYTTGLLVPGDGVRRRVEALMRLGHPFKDIAQAAGVHKSTLSRANTVGAMVRSETLVAVDFVYQRLKNQLGPNETLRARTQRQGWPLPIQWANTNIDDPASAPSSLERTPDPVD